MSQMKYFEVLAMLAALNFVIWPTLNRPPALAGQISQLTGVVTDINGARVANATVTITGDRVSRSVTTSDDGTYNVDLPVGIFRIAVRSKGFCVARRAAFKMEASKSLRLDFTLVVCPIVNAIKIENGKYKGETDAYRSPFKVDEFDVHSSTPAFKLVIQYGRRVKAKNVIRYEGLMTAGDRFLGVIASYNQLTVYADRVRLDKRTLRLEADGNVLLHDGEQALRGQRAEVTFKAGEPAIKLTS